MKRKINMHFGWTHNQVCHLSAKRVNSVQSGFFFCRLLTLTDNIPSVNRLSECALSLPLVLQSTVSACCADPFIWNRCQTIAAVLCKGCLLGHTHPCAVRGSLTFKSGLLRASFYRWHAQRFEYVFLADKVKCWRL